jgi:putative membrane protein
MRLCKIVVSLCAAFTLAAAPGRASAQQPTSAPQAPMTPADEAFARDAAADGLAEVELGQLAVEKAASAEVKSFGKMIVADHSKVNHELKSIAARRSIDLPSEPKPEQKAEKARLEQLNGVAFDQEFARVMSKDHKKAVDLFSKQAGQGQDPELKAWAAQKLPTLKVHHTKAERLLGGKTQAPGGSPDR